MLEDIEQQLKNSAHQAFPPSAEFQAKLRTKLLERREQFRNKPAFSWENFRRIFWKVFVPAGAMFAVLVFMVIPQLKTNNTEITEVVEIKESKSPEATEAEEPKPIFIPKPVVQTVTEQPAEDLTLQPVIPETLLKIGVLEEPGGFEAEEESEGEAEGFAESESASSAAMMGPQPSLDLKREYYDIDGNIDLTVDSYIIISIYPSISQAWAGNGTFEVVDTLPGGLIFSPDHLPDPPVRIDGRRIIFTIPASYFEDLKQGREKPLEYYVRAQTPGTYIVESAQIRSVENPSWQGFSARLQFEVQ